MSDIDKLIEVCLKNNLQSLPAFKQLTLAKKANEKEAVERISQNIINYLKSNKLLNNSSI